jgi:3-hydroxybutyrate dehydrogenase
MLKGRNALITGSTSGIGLGIARILAFSGCNIVLNGFGDKLEIQKLQQSLEAEFGVKILYHDADISKANMIKDMIYFANDKLGNIDILVNNAGIQHVSPIEDFADEKWDDVIAINLSGAFHAIKASIPIMKKSGFGRIINIASAHGLVGSANKGAYVAAKHGIVGLTKVVALETAQLNITCNAICPGWVRTPLVEKQIADNVVSKNISTEEATKNLLFEKQPSLKFVSVEEIGEAVKFLSSELAKSITGIALPIDGGWTAR